ncbi:kinase-like protein [Rhizophagus irregularis]|uniref:Kinase-like protein n=1 Tax=Rhizophagus irregularis TaxID=588596 RepID=A0A2N0RF24_9GLOM|nr:kinase-like protein [Rhizophagus irregularis]
MKLIKEWIEEKITNESIPYFEYDEFSEITDLDSGNFGQVFKANKGDMKIALKIIVNRSSKEKINEADDEFTKELTLLHEIGSHPNINGLLGITKGPKDYILVLEYANDGNLKDYLEEKFASLNWNDKIKMAMDITSGLKFLHSKEIIHRDLHSKNILVNNGKLLIADFGLSKKLADAKTGSVANKMGIIGYIEPLCFNQNNNNYKKDKKSDIYSLGVLLWEISSGRPPFSQDYALAVQIICLNLREKPIESTPPGYQQLYEKCWNGEPKSRPDTVEAYTILSQLSTEDFSYLLSPQPNETNPSVDDNNDLHISSDLIRKIKNLLIISHTLIKLNNQLDKNGNQKALSQLKTGSFDPHLNINLTIPSDSQDLNSRNEKKKKGNPRNLLIIGHAGSGKSTLSNVLSNSVYFEESNCSKNFRKQIFEWEGIEYHVVDDIGMALTNKEVMYKKMSEVKYLIPEGISQILFVIDGKFTAEESTFNLLEDSIFGNDIAEYITIVRTKFSNFKNEKECKKDKDDLYNKNETVAKLCKSIVHIDNPPINIFVHDEDDRETVIVNNRRREQNLIIVGRTNSGKSTLAEVLSDSHYYEGSAICQILFVIDGKITADEVESIFGNDIHEHITIVRTKFSNFKNEDKCKEDLCEQNEAVAKIRQNIVYVDNPPINIILRDEDDEATIKINKKRRECSRTILLDHLNKVFQEKGNKIAIENITEELERQKFQNK